MQSAHWKTGFAGGAGLPITERKLGVTQRIDKTGRNIRNPCLIVAQEADTESTVLSDRWHRSGLIVDTEQNRRRVIRDRRHETDGNIVSPGIITDGNDRYARYCAAHTFDKRLALHVYGISILDFAK